MSKLGGKTKILKKVIARTIEIITIARHLCWEVYCADTLLVCCLILSCNGCNIIIFSVTPPDPGLLPSINYSVGADLLTVWLLSVVAKFYLQGSVAVLIATLIALFSTTVLIEVVKEYSSGPMLQCKIFLTHEMSEVSQLFPTKLYHTGVKVKKT